MPAITVEATASLARLVASGGAVRQRPVRSVTVAPKWFEGEI